MSNQRTTELGERLREALHAFETEGEGVLAKLGDLYDVDVYFRDPLQTLHGRDAFLEMNRRILKRAKRLTARVSDLAVHDDAIFLVWVMTYEPNLGRAIVFEGVTHARTRNGLVIEHRDYWDLLSSVAESIPLVRNVYAALTPHLG